MSIEVIVYDYIDDSGQNCIATWLDSIGVKPKAKINIILYNLGETPQGEWHKFKAAKKLKGLNDLWEIIAFVDKVQWRAIGFFGPGEGAFTLLVGAFEKGNKLQPASTLTTAQTRKVNVQSNPQRYRRRHDYKQALGVHGKP
jgi:hypothetical protein